MRLFNQFFTRNHTVLRLLLPALVFAFSSCEKVIDVDLKDAEPRLVIEGNISNLPGPYTVSLTKSVPFDQTNTFPAVSNAEVTLSDNAGNIEVLTETSPGIYQTATMQGTPGRTYFLKVMAEGKEYTATSTMPQPVQILTINVVKFQFDASKKAAEITFQEPAGIKNYYKAEYIVNGIASDQLLYVDDQFNDGKIVNGTFYDDDLELKSGDNVLIKAQAIDGNVYRYLRDQDQAGSAQAASPANPKTNFTNNPLGYFSAYSETQASIVVP